MCTSIAILGTFLIKNPPCKASSQPGTQVLNFPDFPGVWMFIPMLTRGCHWFLSWIFTSVIYRWPKLKRCCHWQKRHVTDLCLLASTCLYIFIHMLVYSNLRTINGLSYNMTLATQQEEEDTFTQIKHPIAIGLILLIQTVIVCLIRGTIYKSFWFSCILFIIIIGRILVLFIYITRLASNKTFSPSNKILITTSIILPILLYVIPTVTNNKEINAHNTIIENEITTTTTVSARVLIVAH
jgi:hypothetical protein